MKSLASSKTIAVLLGLAWLALRLPSVGLADNLSPKLSGDKFEPDAPVSPAALGMLGVAPTPKNFPRHSAADVEQMFAQSAEIAGAAVFIYQWSDPQLREMPAQMAAAAARNKLQPILGLSPTTLDQNRKELDVPAALRGEKRSFANPKLRAAYVVAAEDLARSKPPYLCLATEINFLALQRLDEFLHFAAAYKEAYRAAKKVSPKTKVFVSFQYEFIRVLDNKEPGKTAEHAKLVEIFRPELDVAAITSYPASFYASPADLPSNYYAHWKQYTRPGDEVLVMEIGWPSGGKSSPEKQRQFVERMPALLLPLAPQVTAWSLLHDVKLPAFGEDLASTGLYTTGDQGKPALALWRKYFRAKQER